MGSDSHPGTRNAAPESRFPAIITVMSSELINAAATVRNHAYAPYSGYLVGAAIQDEQGRIHVGCNVENISYGGAICAERSAATRMIAEGGKVIRRVAVVTSDGGSPCGICRQFLSEFAPDLAAVQIFIASATDLNNPIQVTLADLMPVVFQSDQVNRTAPDRSGV